MFNDFVSWFAQLQGFELILWIIALLFSLLFILQTITSLFNGADNVDVDGDGELGSQFFTVKNMIAFFTMFGWAGLAALKADYNNGVVTLIALGAGTAMVCLMYYLMRNTAKLKHSGTLQMKNAVHQIGETYLRIPANRGGTGKVQVQVQGRFIELDAMTDDNQDIATGRPIQVTSILTNQILLVTSHLN